MVLCYLNLFCNIILELFQPEGQKDPEDGEDYDLEELTNKTYVDQVNKLAEVSGFCKQVKSHFTGKFKLKTV